MPYTPASARTSSLHVRFLPPGWPQVVSAFGCPPVAASALLCWCLCQQLHPPAAGPTAWLAVLGTLGDLGEGGLAGFGLEVLNRAHTEGRKTHFKEAVALLNAGGKEGTVCTYV